MNEFVDSSSMATNGVSFCHSPARTLVGGSTLWGEEEGWSHTGGLVLAEIPHAANVVLRPQFSFGPFDLTHPLVCFPSFETG